MERFENAVFACTCGRTKTELFENADVTRPVPIHAAQYYKLIQDGGQLLHFLVFNTWASFKPNCLFSNANLALPFFKLTFPEGGRTLLDYVHYLCQEAEG